MKLVYWGTVQPNFFSTKSNILPKLLLKLPNNWIARFAINSFLSPQGLFLSKHLISKKYLSSYGNLST